MVNQLFKCAIKIIFLNHSKLIDIIIISAMWFYVGDINPKTVFFIESLTNQIMFCQITTMKDLLWFNCYFHILYYLFEELLEKNHHSSFLNIIHTNKKLSK